MFPLSNGTLIRLNKDGSNGDEIHTSKPNMIFGSQITFDYHIKDAARDVSCEISTDEFGRVSKNISNYMQ